MIGLAYLVIEFTIAVLVCMVLKRLFRRYL